MTFFLKRAMDFIFRIKQWEQAFITNTDFFMFLNSDSRGYTNKQKPYVYNTALLVKIILSLRIFITFTDRPISLQLMLVLCLKLLNTL